METTSPVQSFSGELQEGLDLSEKRKKKSHERPLREIVLNFLETLNMPPLTFPSTPLGEYNETSRLLKKITSFEQAVKEINRSSFEKTAEEISKTWGKQFNEAFWKRRFQKESTGISHECKFISKQPELKAKFAKIIKHVYQLMANIIKSKEFDITPELIRRITKVAKKLQSQGMIKFQISDKIFEIPRAHIYNIKSTYFNSLGTLFKENDEEEMITLKDIDAPVFEKFCQWLKEPTGDHFQSMGINELLYFFGQTERFDCDRLHEMIDPFIASKIYPDNAIDTINILFCHFKTFNGELKLPNTLTTAIERLASTGLEVWKNNRLKYDQNDAKLFFKKKSHHVVIDKKYLYYKDRSKLFNDKILNFLNEAEEVHLDLIDLTLNNEAIEKLIEKFPKTSKVSIKIQPGQTASNWEFLKKFNKLKSVSIIFSKNHSGKECLAKFKEKFLNYCGDAGYKLSFDNLDQFLPVSEYYPHKSSSKTKKKLLISGILSFEDFFYCKKLSQGFIPLFEGKAQREIREKSERIFYEEMEDRHLKKLMEEGWIHPALETIDLSSAKKLSAQGIHDLFIYLNKLKYVKLFDLPNSIYKHLSDLVSNLPNLSVLECPLTALLHLERCDLFFDHLFMSTSQQKRALKLHWLENSHESFNYSWGEFFRFTSQKYPNSSIEISINNNKLFFFDGGHSLIRFTSEGVELRNPDHCLSPLTSLTQTLPLSLDLDYLTSYSQNEHFEHGKEHVATLKNVFTNLEKIVLPLTEEVLINKDMSLESLLEMDVKEIVLKVKADTFFPRALLEQSPLIKAILRKGLSLSLLEILEFSVEDWKKSPEEERIKVFLRHIKFGAYYMKLFKTYHPFKSYSPILSYLNEMMEDAHLQILKPEIFPPTSLFFTNMSKITDRGLTFFLSSFPNVYYLDLRGCSSLTSDGINMVRAWYPDIQIFLPDHLLDVNKSVIFTG